jgi:GNAT superfamily N-acetyltransferase
MTDVKISPATIEDIPELVTLVNSAYRGDASNEGWTNEAQLLEGTRTDEQSLKEIMQTPGEVILKATDDETHLLGCAHLQQKNNDVYLGLLSVLPSAQAKGLGKQLLKASEQFTLQSQSTSIIISVISAREELIAWYLRHGFQLTGETKQFPIGEQFGIQKQPLKLIEMRKVLK